MKAVNVFLIILLLSVCHASQAREVTDTLMSTKNDRVIVTYDVTQSNGQVIVRFHGAQKKLGRTYKDKYKRLDEVAVVFFDRVESFEDMKFTGIDTEAFMTPSGTRYSTSKDGYFLLADNPTLTLNVSQASNQKLQIPFFLAHYEGKHHYKVFSRCENLTVNLSVKKKNETNGDDMERTVTQTVTTQEEVDGAFSDTDEATILVNKVTDLLDEQTEYPFTDELKQAISSLRDRSYRITDDKMSSRISEVLTACKLKEERLKSKAEDAAAAAALAAERKAQQAAERAQARQDSLAAVAQMKAEEDKKRNLWLMIGGVVLAILGFVGNQVLQQRRNAKNQKNIQEMQNSMAKRAEDEARRRARNMVQENANQAKTEFRNGARSVANRGVNTMTKGKGKSKTI